MSLVCVDDLRKLTDFKVLKLLKEVRSGSKEKF